MQLIPMTADTLLSEDTGRVRFRIEKEASGKVTGLTELLADGRTRTSPRSGS